MLDHAEGTLVVERLRAPPNLLVMAVAALREHSEAPAAERTRAGAVEGPSCFRCAISQELMLDPVSTADGHCYERAAIFRWLCANNTSPLTGAPLPNKALTPAIALRQLIQAWREEHPDE
jgi:hypothetical protein